MDEPPGYSFADLFLANNLLFLIATVIMLVLAGILSAAEGAYFALTPDEVETFSRSKSDKDKLITSLLSTPRILLGVLTTWKYVTLIACTVIFSLGLNFSPSAGLLTESIVLTICFC